MSESAGDSMPERARYVLDILDDSVRHSDTIATMFYDYATSKELREVFAYLLNLVEQQQEGSAGGE